MQTIDFIITIVFLLLSVFVGLIFSKRAGSSFSEFFLSGRTMPWWLLGTSMVATTTSTNSFNLFTEIIRKDGISGNWVWWAFLLSGMLTVFIYAKLWHRSGISTDIEFYEFRYSGKIASFLRGFRAVYLGLFFNTIIAAWGILAALKIGVLMFDISPLSIIVIIIVTTVTFSMLGGLRGVLINDFIQFAIVMVGGVVAAVVALRMPQVNGLGNLVTHPDIVGKLDFFPDFSNTDLLVAVFIVPVAVQWWSVWYPGYEPGGASHVVQRMLAAKNEKNSVGAALFFNIVGFGLRPWPWFIIGLCSILVFPDLDSLSTAFPNVDHAILGDDLAYPAMLTFLRPGILGLVVASLLAAFMSTYSTSLNLNSFYLVNDVYKRFINPNATDKQLVFAGRLIMLLLMVLASCFALFLQSAKKGFDIILQAGAGTGLIFILRWFWWRINAWSEITAMTVAFLVAFYLKFIHVQIGLTELPQWKELVLGIVVTTISWLTVTYLTKPADDKTLINFCRVVKAGGPGWKAVYKRAEKMGQPIECAKERWDVPQGILCMLIGCVAVYSALFATGSWLYLRYMQAGLLTFVAIVSTLLLLKFWNHMYRNNPLELNDK
jgi:Na+/proline symporter